MNSDTTSKDLYNSLLNQFTTGAPDHQVLTSLMLAIQRDVEEDVYMLAIHLNYILRLKLSGEYEARNYFTTMKMKYYKYIGYWRAFVSFEIEYPNKPLKKVLETSLVYISLKEFPDKPEIQRYLEGVLRRVEGGKSLQGYVRGYEGGFITLEDVEETGDDDKENLSNVGREASHGPTTATGHTPPSLQPTTLPPNLPTTTPPTTPYSPLPKKEKETPLNKPKYLLNFNLNLNETQPERKLKFSNYQSPDKLKTFKAPIDDTQEIQNMLDEVRNSATFRRGSPSLPHCIIQERHYRKCGVIGKGGNSKVYLVEHNNNFYALKVVNVEMDQKLRKNTLQEIEILKNLKGRYGIIDLIDTRIDPDNIYILLEYGSTDLDRYIKKNNLSLNAIRYFWEQMLRILQVVHTGRYIHADIKPANFVIVDGNLKLIDFNISSKIKADTTRLDLESACGTLNYVAPEVLDSSIRQRRRASDVWSLGIILYEMVYKRVPVDYTTNSGDWLCKIQQIGDSLKEEDGRFGTIIKTIKSCLRVNPKDRPTVDELLKDV